MNATLLEERLKVLKLPGALAHYRRLAENPISYLGDVLSAELERRHENGIRQRIAAAHLPTLKTLDAFDFALQPNVPKMKILAPADGRLFANGAIRFSTVRLEQGRRTASLLLAWRHVRSAIARFLQPLRHS